jgi:molecular chaperone GrpE
VSHRADERGEELPVVVRDRRRIDPVTGAVRTPGPSTDADGVTRAAFQPSQRTEAAQTEAAQIENAQIENAQTEAAQTVSADELNALQAQLDERTTDLQRITAEYANYRKRVDRDREAVVSIAKASVVVDLLGVLDDLERAEAHGDLTGPFRAVADKITAALQKAGLKAFGHEGEPFDPAMHEAVQHATSPDVSGPTVTAVLRRGYTFGIRVLRPALVVVTDHEPQQAGDGPDGHREDALLEPEPPDALARSEDSGNPANGQ